MPLAAWALRTNARVLPLGIDTPKPEFGWKLTATEPGSVQTGYRIQVSPATRFDGELAWDSGTVDSDVPFGILYAGRDLESSRRYFWRVRVCDGAGRAGRWSDPAWFETAKLDPSEFTAMWISRATTDPEDHSPLYLRATVQVAAKPVRGRAYVTALGWYRLFVNGDDVTANALVPRFTPFNDIVEYQTYDVTERFGPGPNVVAMAIGDGRYRGRLGIFRSRAQFGDCLAGFAQFELDLEDGSTTTFVTDERWHAGPGRIVEADPMDGERADLRIPDWDPSPFRPVQTVPPSWRRLVAEEVEPVREVARLPAQRVWRSPSGKQLVDFGQNFAGVVRIRLNGGEGRTVRLTHSELLTPEGELDVEWIRSGRGKPWYQRDEIVLDGAERWYQPWFTIHGFRFVEVEGLEVGLRPGDVEAVVLSSDLAVTGHFDCSDPRLNRLHRNVFWSLRSNFTDTPTDCPTRERSGWTGDIQVFGAAATTLVDAQAFLRRYLRNVALEQYEDGTVPPWVPMDNIERPSATSHERVMRGVATSTGWGDVAVMLPWTLYRYYGDRLVLERQYDSMKRWVDHLAREASDGCVLSGGFHWGEWLRPADEDTKVVAEGVAAPEPVVATAYFAHSTRLFASIADVLGRHEDAATYAELAGRVRTAWRSAFVHEGGRRIGDDKQDDYVRALAFDLVTPGQRQAALDRLVELIEGGDFHLGTGFLSTGLLLPVLADNGRPDVAFRILLQDTDPSWLSQIERGATTVWETWEGFDELGRGRLSHNHYAFGAVAAWLQEGIAGLSPAAPGYRRIRIAPHVGGGLNHAKAALDTPFGVAVSAWRVTDRTVSLDVTVPPGTTAEVHLGDGRVEDVGSGTHHFQWGIGVGGLDYADGKY